MIVELFEGRVITFKHKDLSGKFQLEKVKKTRSNQQNKYLHGYLFPEAARAMSMKIGKQVTPTLAKAVLKSKCGVFYVEAIEEWVVIPTSKQTTGQMVSFIEKSLKYIAEKTGEYLEEPNEEQWRQIQEEK